MATDGSPHVAHALSLMRFIDRSPSPFHVVESARALLTDAGFKPVDDSTPGGLLGRRFLVRDGSILAWNADADTSPRAPVRIVGAHTDSPNLRLKPQPITDAYGYRRLGVEVYGGVLLNSWLDRDLGISGRLVVRGGQAQPDERLVHVTEPLLRIPQLAIHLGRDVNDKGLVLNRQNHLGPIYGLTGSDDIWQVLSELAGVAQSEILSSDLMLHDVQPSAMLGNDGAFVSAPRIDNQLSCHAAITALTGSSSPDCVSVVALFDHEEVGSVSHTGARTTILPRLIDQLVRARGGQDSDVTAALADGLFVSADNAHGTHPNYPERHDPDHYIGLNAGPVLKHNSNQRYTTDARTAALFHLAAERAGVSTQEFVSRGDMPCGSTIGPTVAASLGMRALDLGCAQLAMHSCREIAGAADAWDLTLILAELLRG